MQRKDISLFNIFWTFIKIGAFTFGGGYAMIPIIEKELVHEKKWIEDKELIDIIAVSQSIPGALAVNLSVFIGNQLKSWLGAIISCVGVVLPSFITIVVIAEIFEKFNNSVVVQTFFTGIRPAVVSLILLAILQLKQSVAKNWINLILIVGSFVSIEFLNINPIIVIIVSGVVGYIFFKEREGEQLYETN
ncbi:chromate transporter [Irregularibacter muris]|uniref:Chromate transporter n=1 Tax=Irregularibacter muris TaxID=1796619 RepID=A0AAE3HH19_9FIRM|nr:chromate transporter [Irregularibacter muris]MCR1899407.1 chromate transporter [Irregularibacter muris]